MCLHAQSFKLELNLNIRILETHANHQLLLTLLFFTAKALHSV